MNHRVLLLVSQKELPTVLRLRQKEKKKKKSIKLTGASDKCAASGEFVDPFDSNRILQRSVIGKRERGGGIKAAGTTQHHTFFLVKFAYLSPWSSSLFFSVILVNVIHKSAGAEATTAQQQQPIVTISWNKLQSDELLRNSSGFPWCAWSCLTAQGMLKCCAASYSLYRDGLLPSSGWRA